MFQQFGYVVMGCFLLLLFVFIGFGIYHANKENWQPSSGKRRSVRFFLLATLTFGIAFFTLIVTEDGFSWEAVGTAIGGTIIIAIMFTGGEIVNRISTRFFLRFLGDNPPVSPVRSFIALFNMVKESFSNRHKPKSNDDQKD